MYLIFMSLYTKSPAPEPESDRATMGCCCVRVTADLPKVEFLSTSTSLTVAVTQSFIENDWQMLAN